jgi:hypothetical protein
LNPPQFLITLSPNANFPAQLEQNFSIFTAGAKKIKFLPVKAS